LCDGHGCGSIAKPKSIRRGAEVSFLLYLILRFLRMRVNLAMKDFASFVNIIVNISKVHNAVKSGISTNGMR